MNEINSPIRRHTLQIKYNKNITNKRKDTVVLGEYYQLELGIAMLALKTKKKTKKGLSRNYYQN